MAALWGLLQLVRVLWCIMDMVLRQPRKPYLDLELDQSHLWVVEMLRSLLEECPDLRDFSGKLDFTLPNLYPATLAQCRQEPAQILLPAERLLESVQSYVTQAGLIPPAKGSESATLIAPLCAGMEFALKRLQIHKEMAEIMPWTVKPPAGEQSRQFQGDASKGKEVPDVLEVIRDVVAPLSSAVAEIKSDIKSMQPHVRGVPKVLSDLKEASLVPEEAAREIFAQIQTLLTIEEQRIWTAVRNAGTQKAAIALLREDGIDLSEATLSRLVSKIDKKLAKQDLPPCKASGPLRRYKMRGGHRNDEGKPTPEILEPDRDWAKDPDTRERIIRLYLGAHENEKRDYQQYYEDIEDEAKEYRRRKE
jgi:hypothetical protein